jgi:hydrogenase expression/formation protein HypE
MALNLSCPLPPVATDRILLAHGGGGKLMNQLLEQVILPAIGNGSEPDRHDGATFAASADQLAFTTDSYVVHPFEFPGGNVGDLAIHGTVNDLAMCGAEPAYLSVALILEEGLTIDALNRVLYSMRDAARQSKVRIVTGDTKVVEHGKGDGIFITTAGVGRVRAPRPIAPAYVEPGDAIIVSGDLGRHGIAVMSVREGLEFETPILSDTAPLWEPVRALLDAGVHIHCLRDLTRGGLASSLNEIASAAQAGMMIEDRAVPIEESVQGACEILGLDPFYVANEGRFVAFVPEFDAARAVHTLRQFSGCRSAARIGTVRKDNPGLVLSRTPIGGTRVVDMLSGEQLPRIC